MTSRPSFWREALALGLLLALAACNLPAATPQPPGLPSGAGGPPAALPPASSPPPTAQPTFTSAPWPTLAPPSPTAIPSLTPTTVPPTPAPAATPERIRFAPGAIRWQKTLDPGQRAFIFGAMQGQSAEILLTQGNHPARAALVLWAPNGQPLQTAAAGRPDWRGLLPQTGEYRLRIDAPEGESVAGLLLTVTIYPPLRQPHVWQDTGIGYRLVYDGARFQPREPLYDTALSLELTYAPYFDGTNLSEAFFLLALESPTEAEACQNAPSTVVYGFQPTEETWVVNGVTYWHGQGFEGAAGNLYQAEIYRAFIHDRCITVYFLVHSLNIGNFDPGTVREYDAQAVEDEFKRLFFTLQWP